MEQGVESRWMICSVMATAGLAVVGNMQGEFCFEVAITILKFTCACAGVDEGVKT